jgi:hypothetical protein
LIAFPFASFRKYSTISKFLFFEGALSAINWFAASRGGASGVFGEYSLQTASIIGAKIGTATLPPVRPLPSVCFFFALS